jgi:glycosyltransferase involved in cell wall biosynthesis
MINVLLEAPIMTQSGYGEHSRLVFRALRKIDGVKLYVSPLEWGATSWASSFDKQEVEDVQSCINDLMHAMSNNMQPNFDVQIHVGILNEFEKKAPYSICVTAGVETDRVSAEWLIRTYKGVNKIITPSEHAASGFRDTSYTAINQNTNSETLIECNPETVVDVVPYPVKQKEVKSLEFNLDTEFNFLSVALLGPRKNIELMCKWFVEEFKDDNVGLVVKTGRSRGSIIDKNHTRSILKPHINLQGKKCKVYLLHGSLEESEIHSLYKRNDVQAYVTATSGEGFGLPVFEAAYSGMPIVATDWSAHTEFLSAPYKEGNKKKEKKLFAKVDYELQPIPPHVVWKDILVEDSRWAIPKENSFKKQLRNMYKNYGMYKKWAKALQDNLLKTHENDLILDNMSKAIIKDLPPEISFKLQSQDKESQEVVVFQ